MNLKRLIGFLLLSALVGATLSACARSEGGGKKSFLQVGEFAINRVSADRTEVTDGAGRKLVLIPRNAPLPGDCDPSQVIRVPVKSVVAYGDFDVATLAVLGVLEETLVGVTRPEKRWYRDDVRKGFSSGRIVYLGEPDSLDYEKLKQQQPELVLTWDPSVIPMLDELKIPAVVTSTPVAMCLNARMGFVKFLAPFFNREKEAEAYFRRVNDALTALRAESAKSRNKKKVMWGDIYEKRVLVEPGNAWVGELLNYAETDYLFNDVYGTSCIEISVERFLSSGEEADVYFTYRGRSSGVTSKEALARVNPLVKNIRPITHGTVYLPLPHYSQSGDRLDEIFTELAAIVHPDVYPGYRLKFFEELPAKESMNKGKSL